MRLSNLQCVWSDASLVNDASSMNWDSGISLARSGLRNSSAWSLLLLLLLVGERQPVAGSLVPLEMVVELGG